MSALPFGAEALLALLSRDAQQIAGDLLEESALYSERRGPLAARRWLWRQLAGSIFPLLRRRASALGLPLLAGALAATSTASALVALWRFILWLVPLRADHPPQWPLLLGAAAALLLAFASGFAAARALTSNKGARP